MARLEQRIAMLERPAGPCLACALTALHRRPTEGQPEARDCDHHRTSLVEALRQLNQQLKGQDHAHTH